MKLLTERSEEKFWSSFNFFNSFFYIYKSAGCRQSIFFTHIANKLFFSHTFGSKLFLGVNLANKLFFYEKTIPPPGIKWSAPKRHLSGCLGPRLYEAVGLGGGGVLLLPYPQSQPNSAWWGRSPRVPFDKGGYSFVPLTLGVLGRIKGTVSLYYNGRIWVQPTKRPLFQGPPPPAWIRVDAHPHFQQQER